MTVIPKAADTAKKQTAGQKISRMMTLLQALPRARATDELYAEVCAWIQDLPAASRPESLLAAVGQAFARSKEDVHARLDHKARHEEFDVLVPKEGFLHDYVEWTRETEPPTVFHFFVAATVLGAALARNVFFDKGPYSVFPNLCVMIVAPSGRCRKTSACNVGTGLFSKIGGTLLADKSTPEALVDAFKTQANATGLIYAPELAVFLGKQKYQEGMIPLLTSLFDCPKEWTSKTIGRGETSLTNVALSALFCSTLDWIQTGIPSDAFGGGFMSRLIFVVQENTPRVFPLPPPLPAATRTTLVAFLAAAKRRKGQFTFEPSAERWYRSWYHARPSLQGDKQYAGYYERKPDHIIRLAMILHVARADDFILVEDDLVLADRMLSWLEDYLPHAFSEMTESTVGADQARILRQLRQAGGSMEHSPLLRRNSSKMNSDQFKRAMTTLREAGLCDWNAQEKTYTLTPQGWDGA